MEHFIEKNLLIDDLLELEISYIPDILDMFNELRNTNNIDNDIELLNRTLYIIDNIIWENNEHLKTIVDLEFEYNYVSQRLNDLYIGKHKICSFIDKINQVDFVSDLISEMNIK
jgi:hypothetical protein